MMNELKSSERKHNTHEEKRITDISKTGYLSLKENKINDAIDCFSKILKLDENNNYALVDIGDAYRNMNSFDKAKEFYEKALNIEFDIYAVFGIAMILKAREKYDEAVISIKRLIQQDNMNYRFYTELYDCYLKMGDRLKAVETLEDFQKTGVKNKKITEILESI